MKRVLVFLFCGITAVYSFKNVPVIICWQRQFRKFKWQKIDETVYNVLLSFPLQQQVSWYLFT